MELKQAYEAVMGEAINMALPTSVDGQPNVRVVPMGAMLTTLIPRVLPRSRGIGR